MAIKQFLNIRFPGVKFICPTLNQINICKDVIIRSGSIIYDNVYIGTNTTIDHFCIIRQGVSIESDCRILNRSEIGQFVKIGEKCRLRSNICSRSSIGSNCTIYGDLIHKYDLSSVPTDEMSPTIENDVFIGKNALIIGGVNVPSGVFIKAGSIHR